MGSPVGKVVGDFVGELLVGPYVGCIDGGAEYSSVSHGNVSVPVSWRKTTRIAIVAS